MNRRNFIQTSALGVLAWGKLSIIQNKPERKAPLCYFTKELQWLSYDELGLIMNEMGFDGVDITLRKGGSIEPENIKQELPKLIKTISKYGISAPMMATNIADIKYPKLEEFLSIAKDNGIQYYRMAYLKYDDKLSIDSNIEVFHRTFQELAELNEKVGIAASYQNHDGTALGASIWDTALALKGLDKRYVGAQFDIRHAVVEGGHSWPNDFKAIKPYINTIVTKDFIWDQKDDKTWYIKNVPLGEGMVDFDKYFKLYHDSNLDVPMTNHTEYPIFTEDEEHLSTKEKINIIFPKVKKDLDFIKQHL